MEIKSKKQLRFVIMADRIMNGLPVKQSLVEKLKIVFISYVGIAMSMISLNPCDIIPTTKTSRVG